MRINLPVTSHEHPFPPGETLVSTTDIKGRITHCNSAFVKVSGYTRDELLGQPHNLIRHPDMPAEAFRDLWATVATGRPWSGLVKNRRKDGAHYWVQANVTPVLDGDQVVGYMSVRTEPVRAQVAAAEALYATMRAEAAAGRLLHHLQQGQPIAPGWAGLVARVLPHCGWIRTAWLSVLLAGGSLGLGLALGGVMPGPATLLGGVALAGLAAALVAWRLHVTRTRPLGQLLGFVNRMAAGDFSRTVQADRSSELGALQQGLNQLNVNVRSVVRDARREAELLREVAAALGEGSRDLAGRTESQAAQVEQTAASMTQITGNVRQTSDVAARAAQLGTQATQVSEASGDAVHQVTQTMHAINESSQRIGEIVQLIDSIAFQTNLLALNAAVEAARAGEQGRGFAVVASEVRMLAQRSSNAAREIKSLIEVSSQRVETGAAQSDEARTSMDGAVAAARHVNQLIAEINGAAQQQLDGIAQVNQSVKHIDALTHQNADMVRSLAELTGSLQQQSNSLVDAMRVFRVDHGPRPPAPDAVALRQALRKAA